MDNRPPRRDGAKPMGAKPAFHKGGSRPTGDRPAFKKDGARPAGDRPAFRKDGARPAGDRPTFRKDGARPASDRPAFRKDGARPAGDRPAFRKDGTRPAGDRPAPRPMGMPHPAAKPEQTAPSGANPRLVAVNVLCDVMEKDSYAALSLDEKLSSVNLNQLDRRLCASIVYRTLENLYYLDFALNGLLTDPDALEPKVRAILRTAACQILLHDRVPDSADVNEAVNLTRALRLDYATGMVNAVLRKLAAGKEEIKWPDVSEGAHALHVLYSLPEWLAEQLIRDYGVEEAVKIASFRTERHSITIRPTYGKEKEFEAQLAKKVWETEKGVVPGAVYVYGAMQIARDSDFAAGLFSIQGEGSMLAAEAVGARPGMQILDACAAPGGKTAYLAERMGGAGRVYAWDLHDHRAELIRGTVRRLHLDNVRVAARDASHLRSDMVGTMDAVLLDAPCSGLGVMDDKPDVKYRPTPESIEELTETQKKLLDTCCEYVRPGGVMVYSTCSMLKDENERQIEAFLQRHPEFTVEALPATVPEQLRAVAGPYGLQLLPHRDHVEGFFVARMRKSK